MRNSGRACGVSPDSGLRQVPPRLTVGRPPGSVNSFNSFHFVSFRFISFNEGVVAADERGVSSPYLALLTTTGSVVVGGVAFLIGRATQRQTAPVASAGDPSIAALAKASSDQANAMVKVAELSAQSLRAASGTYVFSLRDRFDDRLPAMQVGVASTLWQALGEAPAAVEFLVFHPGDIVRFTLTLVVNQVAVDRRITIVHTATDPRLTAQPAKFQASSARSGQGAEFVCPSDVSLFVDLCFDVDMATLAAGERFILPASVRTETADTRPEGAIASVGVEVCVSGTAVPDEDGIGLDLLAIEATIGDEKRAYFLDKAEQLPLSLPGT